MDPSSIDKIIATERRRHRWRSFWVVVSMATFFCGAVVTALAEHAILVPPFLVSRSWIGIAAGWTVSLVVMLITLPLTRPPRDANLPEVLRRQIETYQGRYRAWVVMMGAIPGVYAACITFLPDVLPTYFSPPAFAELAFYALLVLCVLPFVLFGFRRPNLEIPEGVDLNDELVRDLRLKAVRVGYVVVMVALTGAFVWLLIAPGDAVKILPWILAGGLIVPAVVFALLHWRAGREK
jgi:hypothetical protein